MKILILNWRDIKNPSSGGAEIMTHQLAKGLVEKGHQVTQFSSYFKGARKKEILDGIEIIRQGHPDARTLFFSVQFKAFIEYFKTYRGNIDLVIDEFHGNPFFSPLYMKERKIALVCEVGGDLWDIAVAPPFNVFGKLMEKILPLFYRNVVVLTISNSSKEDLLGLGFKKNQIKIIPLGSSSRLISKFPKKEKALTLIFLSRLTRSKGIEDALSTIAILRKDFPEIKLWIVGRGDESYVKELIKLAKKLNVQKNLIFFGFVKESEKESLLGKAHLLISPSVKEGWGLTIHEAGARGTPSVVYNVSGLKDVVKNGVNGILCKKNSPTGMALEIEKLFDDKRLYLKLQKGAIEERKKHSWEELVEFFLKSIQ